MAVSVQMPKQGNTVVECLLVEWRVKEGDSVKAGDILCAIETDKASFEVPSTADGVVLKLLAKAGDLVPVLSDIAIVGEAGENLAAASQAKAAGTAEEPQDAAGGAETVIASVVDELPHSDPASWHEEKAISPRARKLANHAGVDAALLAGSGPGGRVTSRDVQAALDSRTAAKTSTLAKEIMAATGLVPGAATGIGGRVLARDLVEKAAPAPVPAPAAIPAGAEPGPDVVPYKGIRKLIGDRMRQSLLEHAQLTMNASADASGLVALRKIFKDEGESLGLPKISLNDMICWVVAQTLPSFPELNAVFERTGGTIVRHRRVHLAFAVDTPRGLMVPVATDAHRLSLAGLSRVIAQYAEDCRRGSINPDHLVGGTFTVSNLGGLGVESFTPILNSPQVGILGVSAITNVPQPKPDGGYEFKPRLGLSLTIDHQAVDGAPGAKFLQTVAKGMENIQATLATRGAS